MDGSDSIGEGKFKHMLDVLKHLVTNFEISPQRTRVGFVLYSSTAKLEFDFSRHSDIASLRNAIGAIKYPRGSTYTGNALRRAREWLFPGAPRQGAKQVVLVMTDGSSSDGVVGPANDLKLKSGVIIYSLGIGSNVNMNQLKQMASPPYQAHVFNATFESMGLVLQQIKKEVCRANINNNDSNNNNNNKNNNKNNFNR